MGGGLLVRMIINNRKSVEYKNGINVKRAT